MVFKLTCSQGNREAPDKYCPSSFSFRGSRYEQFGPILQQVMAKLILKTLGLQPQWCLLTCNELLARTVHKNAELFLDNCHLKQWKTSFGADSSRARARRIQPSIPKRSRNLPEEDNDLELGWVVIREQRAVPNTRWRARSPPSPTAPILWRTFISTMFGF